MLNRSDQGYSLMHKHISLARVPRKCPQQSKDEDKYWIEMQSNVDSREKLPVFVICRSSFGLDFYNITILLNVINFQLSALIRKYNNDNWYAIDVEIVCGAKD